MLVAGAIAVLVYPAVEFGARWLPRLLVVVLLVIVSLGAIGFVGYRIVNDVTVATTGLQQAAPQRAAELEKNSDVLAAGPAARAGEATSSTTSRTGSPADPATKALKSAATQRGRVRRRHRSSRSSSCSTARGSSRPGCCQIRDPRRRARVEQVIVRGAQARPRLRARQGARGVRGRRARVRDRARGGCSRAGRARRVGRPVDAPAGRGRVRRRAADRAVRGRVVAHERGAWSALAFVAIGIGDVPVQRRSSSARPSRSARSSIVFAAFAGLELYGLTGALLGVLGVVVLVVDPRASSCARRRPRLASLPPSVTSVHSENDGARRREPAAGAVHAARAWRSRPGGRRASPRS